MFVMSKRKAKISKFRTKKIIKQFKLEKKFKWNIQYQTDKTNRGPCMAPEALHGPRMVPGLHGPCPMIIGAVHGPG